MKGRKSTPTEHVNNNKKDDDGKSVVAVELLYSPAYPLISKRQEMR